MIVICQMPVESGNLRANTNYILDRIVEARKSGAEIIVFPEMAVSGYLVGDWWELENFIQDIEYFNQKIIQASQGIIVIFGSLIFDRTQRGEDGRTRKFNTGIIAQNGKLIGSTIKTLQPNYRFFDDDRYFFSTRKKTDEAISQGKISQLKDQLNPFVVQFKKNKIKIGIILCEDMWHEDYAYNPAQILKDQGAELIFNLSASPWGWQKNQKRHRVAQALFAKGNGAPLIYVNCVGSQNNGKNLLAFDGSSTVYNSLGEVIWKVSPYSKGNFSFSFDREYKIEKEPDDSQAFYSALCQSAQSQFNLLSNNQCPTFIGLSGGIDSAVSLAFLVSVLGKDRVVAVNMPSQYSSQETQSLAKNMAQNIGVRYLVCPIQKIVKTIAEVTDAKQGTLTYENIQARARMEVLAALAQKENGVFICNSNKVEIAFGYGTLYGDMAGFFAPLGDLVKREVYQLGDYLNKVIFKQEIIPTGIFSIAPTAELNIKQKDPFYYGNLEERGYHDEMVRAFTEYRRDIGWFAREYKEGTLEETLKLNKNTLKILFPTDQLFFTDLEKRWSEFTRAVFKRIQAPPIPVISKRAFGFDLRESLLPTYFNNEYLTDKK